MRGAIARLSERERHILSLVHVQELPGAEIGRMLGVSESRVSQILAGIRRKLKDQLESYETPPRPSDYSPGRCRSREKATRSGSTAS